MSFEYIIEKDNSTKKLSTEEESILIKKISSKFSALNSERAHNLEMASNLSNLFRINLKNGKQKSKCAKHLCFTKRSKPLSGEILMQMLILCLTCREKITTQITPQTNKKQCWLTFLKKWVTREPATRLSITLYFMVN